MNWLTDNAECWRMVNAYREGAFGLGWRGASCAAAVPGPPILQRSITQSLLFGSGSASVGHKKCTSLACVPLPPTGRHHQLPLGRCRRRGANWKPPGPGLQLALSRSMPPGVPAHPETRPINLIEVSNLPRWDKYLPRRGLPAGALRAQLPGSSTHRSGQQAPGAKTCS
jgi:hypothetical protein